LPESLSIASMSAVAEPALIPRSTARVAIRILLTVLDSWAVVVFRGMLCNVSAHHPIWLTGIVLLFVSLFASLARTWYLALPVRPR
jgi:hypothetical protein